MPRSFVLMFSPIFLAFFCTRCQIRVSLFQCAEFDNFRVPNSDSFHVQLFNDTSCWTFSGQHAFTRQYFFSTIQIFLSSSFRIGFPGKFYLEAKFRSWDNSQCIARLKKSGLSALNSLLLLCWSVFNFHIAVFACICPFFIG